MKARAVLAATGFLFLVHADGQEWYLKPALAISSNMYYQGMCCAAGNYVCYGAGRSAANVLNTGGFSKYDPVSNTSVYLGSLPGNVGRTNGTSFGIGNYAYFGMGADDVLINHDDIYRYDVNFTDAVVTIPPFPAGPRMKAFAFALGNKAYVGGGNNNGDLTTNAFHAYDPATNAWTNRAPCPGTNWTGPTFTLGGKGYIVLESPPSSVGNVWEYDPALNLWSSKAPYPGGNTSGKTAFAHGTVGMVGSGNATQTFWAFDPVANTWSTAPALWASYGRSQAYGASLNGKGYVLFGVGPSNAVLNDIWEFGAATSPQPDTWYQRPFFPGPGRYRPVAFSIGTVGYAGGGSSLTDFYSYQPQARIWTARADLPGNADVGLSIGSKGYVILQSATQNFWEYDPTTNTWTVRADLPGGARSLAAGFALEGKCYVGGGWINGVRQSDLWAYDPATNTWTGCAAIPDLPRHSASAFAIGNKGYLAGGNIGGGTAALHLMYRYDPVLNNWTLMGSLPLGNRQNAQAFAIGNKAFLGGGQNVSYFKRFDVYDPITNTWTPAGNLGGNFRYGGAGFAIGASGYVFAGSVNPTTSDFPGSGDFALSSDLWEFSPAVVSIASRVLLEGPFNTGNNLMNDALRSNGLLTRTDPFGSNGYTYPGGTYGDLGNGSIPTITGNDAVVDRIVLELRDATIPSTLRASRSLWIQRDGDVVDMDGTSPVRFTVPPGNYHVALRHRNHLPCMTANAVALSASPVTLDLTTSVTPTYGTNARKTVGAKLVLWAGDVNFNNTVSYTGAANDRDAILIRVGGTTPNNSMTGYYPEDVNLDGTVKYTGAANDRDPILINVGSTTPNNVRVGQLP